jgi:dTDP-4-amino-4,6-dideoxygalactose transaminase
MPIYEPIDRPEFKILKESGHQFNDPYEAVELFEKTIAQYTGAPYAVATDCATHAIELCFHYLRAKGKVVVPNKTYPSVPMTAMKCGLQIEWNDRPWLGHYQLEPFPIIDASLAFHSNLYTKGLFYCLSFQQKKRLGIGRGGMILTDDKAAYDWLKRACHDGRTPGVRWHQDNISMIGYHYYMTPDDAARGILLFNSLNPKDQLFQGGSDNYPSIDQFEVFKL